VSDVTMVNKSCDFHDQLLNWYQNACNIASVLS